MKFTFDNSEYSVRIDKMALLDAGLIILPNNY